MRKLNIGNYLLITFLFPTVVFAKIISGEVIKISDGDTLTILTNENKQIKIRLSEIDAPEKNQAYGKVSRQALADLCFRKHAIIYSIGKDKYGRTLGRVNCNAIDANAEQIKTGMAWVYDKYVTDKSLYELQKTAKNQKLGLWADENPTPPWLFRRN
ncbi:TPA: thermonuclease family protein [Legionella pneumophila]|uniref:thermonuclease family protein n=1 Tax=Legionella pneumophila TaxID=446 RepID=UPI001C1A9C51|nr:thermonuclease family protein [Legionella pneumophila]